MSSIVHVQHPAPLRHVPAGGRHERLSFVSVTTPVRLKEIGACEIPSVGHIQFGANAARDIHAHEGRLWVPLTGRNPDGGRRQPISGAELSRFLSGEMQKEEWERGDIRSAFGRTPVIALEAGQSFQRGHAAETLRSRRIVHDGTDRAREDLERYLGRNVLIAGGNAYVRLPGPLMMQAYTGPNQDTPCMEALAMPDFTTYHPTAFCRWDRLQEWWGFRRDTGDSMARKRLAPHTYGLYADLTGVEFDDADLEAFVNKAAEDVVERLGKALKAAPVADPGTRLGLEDQLRGLVPYADLARTRSIRPEEWGAAMLRIREAVAVFQEGCPAASGLRYDASLEMVVRYIDRVALPRIGQAIDAPVSPDDENALSGLQP